MIAKLRGRSFAELTGRLRQQVGIVAERCGYTPSVILPPAMSLLPSAPWPVVNPDAVKARLTPTEQAGLVARADRIVSGVFDVLGLESLSYGVPPDWQRDPLSGRSAPRTHWSRVPYLAHEVVGDHKVTWELNRHQWLIRLGQAYVLTGNPVYPATADRLLNDWLRANPPKVGINWCSALELAFRVQSWIHGLLLFGDAAQLTPATRKALVESAAAQIAHVVNNLSTWFSPNTHLTGEALAMLSVGCAWPQLPQAERWRAEGWAILCEQAPIQIRDDGVYFEQSPWYQSYTVDFYVLGITWARMAGLPVPAGVLNLTQRAAAALRAVTRPDGTVVRFGDDDGGRTLPLTTAAFGDMTDSLWRAAWLFDDAALIPPATNGRDALLWLEGAEAFDSMSGRVPSDGARRSRALPHGGWCTLAESADSADHDHWLVMDAGPHGALSHAHSHADALAIDLSVHGTPILVDAGTGAYVGPNRRIYRSTAMHNTVTVDGTDSSEQGTSFTWRSATNAVLDGFGVAQGASFVMAHHDGYRRLSDPVRHTRTVLRLHRHYWLMFDTLDAQATHTATLTLQAAPAVDVVQAAPHRFTMTAPGSPGRAVALHIVVDPRMTARVDARQVSPAYALELPADALSAEYTGSGPVSFCTVMGAEDEAAPIAIEWLGDADAWKVTHAHGADYVARPNSTAVTLGPARFDGQALALLGADEPHTIVAAGAGTLHLAGRAYLLAGDDVRLARRAPDGTWTMES